MLQYPLDVSVVDLEPDKEKALNLALNKIAGSWDDTRLAELLQELKDSDTDTLLSGFDEEEIQGLLVGFDPNTDLGDFFCDAPEKDKMPKMTVCPFCGKEHEV